MQYKGIVQENVVMLEEGVHLPNGTRVTVTVEQKKQAEAEITPDELAQRQALIAQMKAFGERLSGR